MPYIMNALTTIVSTQAHGKWFTWKPQEIKHIDKENLAMFLSQHRGEEGLVDVPVPVMELDRTSEEYKAAIEEKRMEGIAKRIQKLDSIKQNLLGSLRLDVETKGIKSDPLVFASKGELAALKELHGLKEYEQKQHLNTAEEIRKLLEGIDNGSSGSTNSGKTNTGSPNPVKPAKS